MQARGWCFTLNNPEYEPRLCAISNLCYAIFGHELAPTTNTPHLQGYLLFTKRQRLTQLVKVMPGAHFEVARGTPEQNRLYCSKGSDIQIFGVCPTKTQGKRTDLDEAAEEIKTGKSLTDIASNYSVAFIKYSRGFTALQNALYKPTIRTGLKVYVLYGPSGVGKTRWAYDHYPIDQIYKLNSNDNGSLWFDGYTNQKVLLIDDFRGWIRYKTMLTLLDIYPFQCQIKGSTVFAAWDTIVITSDVPPDQWYHFAIEGGYEQLQRRLSEVHNCSVSFPAI